MPPEYTVLMGTSKPFSNELPVSILHSTNLLHQAKFASVSAVTSWGHNCETNSGQKKRNEDYKQVHRCSCPSLSWHQPCVDKKLTLATRYKHSIHAPLAKHRTPRRTVGDGGGTTKDCSDRAGHRDTHCAGTSVFCDVGQYKVLLHSVTSAFFPFRLVLSHSFRTCEHMNCRIVKLSIDNSISHF